jgi:hypothetical protein
MDTFWERAACARAGHEGRRRDDEFVEDAADPEQIDEQERSEPQSVGARSMISASSVRNEQPELCHMRPKSLRPTLKAADPG